MSYCPNINTKEFKEMEASLGKEVATTVWFNNNGNHIDMDRNGKPSQLFKDAVSFYGSRSEAIKIKAQIFTKSYLANDNWINNKTEPTIMDMDPDFNSVETFRIEHEGIIKLDEAKTWLEQRGIPFNSATQIVEIANHIPAYAAGSYTDGLVYLSLNSPIGTAYHEAFHAAFSGFLTPAKRKKILKLAKERYYT